MADWVCAGTGGRKKRESDKEMEKERKWEHLCEKTHQDDEVAIVPILRQHRPHARLHLYQRVKKG